MNQTTTVYCYNGPATEIEINESDCGTYHYMYDNTSNCQVCDDDGNPIRFQTKEECEEYLQDIYEAIVTPAN